MSKLILIVALLSAFCLFAMAAKAKKETHRQYDLKTVEKLWQEWLTAHPNIKFHTEEAKKRRFLVFKNNIKKINDKNKRKDEDHQKVGPLAHLTRAEYEAWYLGVPVKKSQKRTLQMAAEVTDLSGTPAAIDWVVKKKVTPPRNQGKCGSCWSFSSIAAVEAAWAIKKGPLRKLSEQQLIDCSQVIAPEVNPADGCKGRWPLDAMNYIVANGIKTLASYPYKAKQGSCKANAASIGARLTSAEQLPANSYPTVLNRVGTVGPVTVIVDATPLQNYGGGVISKGCGALQNHAVTIVGYGKTKKGVPFWKVKNSWGPNWGEKGYFRIKRGTTNHCHILDYVVSPIV
jgi:C1A family cysteine protease